MNEVMAPPPRVWHIVESGDRWQQAVLRFVRTADARHGSSEPSIRRLRPEAAGELVESIRQGAHSPAPIVLWELPHSDSLFIETLESIAGVSRCGVNAIQLAYLPQTRRELKLAVQSAGAAILLSGTWSLQPIVKRLTVAGTPPLTP